MSNSPDDHLEKHWFVIWLRDFFPVEELAEDEIEPVTMVIAKKGDQISQPAGGKQPCYGKNPWLWIRNRDRN